MGIRAFDDFHLQLLRGTHQFQTHTFKLVLCNVAPVDTNSLLGDLTQISAGNGYTAGGFTLSNVALTKDGGTTKVTADAVSIVASGGSIGPFEYIAIYNDTAANDPLVAWEQIPGGARTVTDGNTLNLNIGGANGFTIVQRAA